MIISFVVAVAEDNAIGIKNELPWRLPEDLKFFKRTTMGKPVIMGRKTYESLGKPLPGRENIVLSTRKGLSIEGVHVYHDISEAIKHLEDKQTEEACIIGGGQIFTETMNLADRLYITRVKCTVPGADAYFPDIDHTHWKLTWEEPHQADEKHAYDYTFQRYDRIEL